MNIRNIEVLFVTVLEIGIHWPLSCRNVSVLMVSFLSTLLTFLDLVYPRIVMLLNL